MEDVIITMDRIPVRMHRVSNPTDLIEKVKEDHEKQYEEQEKPQVKIVYTALDGEIQIKLLFPIKRKKF